MMALVNIKMRVYDLVFDVRKCGVWLHVYAFIFVVRRGGTGGGVRFGCICLGCLLLCVGGKDGGVRFSCLWRCVMKVIVMVSMAVVTMKMYIKT